MEVVSDTVEDWIASATAPVADQLHDRFVVLTDAAEAPNGPELLSVDVDDTKLVHYRSAPPPTDGKTYASTWLRAEHEVPCTHAERDNRIIQIKALQHDRERIAFIHYADAARERLVEPIIYDETADRWRPWQPEVDPDTGEIDGSIRNAITANAQMGIYRDRAGRPIVYGTGTNYASGRATLFALVRDAGTGRWSAARATFAGTEATRFRLLPAWDGNADVTIMKIDPDAVGFLQARIRWSDDAWAYRIEPLDSGWRTIDSSALPLFSDIAAGAEGIHPLPEALGTAGFLFHVSHQLYLITGCDTAVPAVQRLTEPDSSGAVPAAPTGITSVALGWEHGIGSDCAARLYAREESGSLRLWTLELKPGAAPQAPPQCGGWICLGEGMYAIGCAARTRGGSELFVVSEGSDGAKIALWAKGPSQTSWYAQQVDAATDGPQKVNRTIVHKSQIKLYDPDGLPLTQANGLRLYADCPCTAIVNGAAHRLAADPAHAVEVSTTGSGELEIMLEATDLSAPTLLVAPMDVDIADAVPFQPAAAVARRLAGKEPGREVSVESLRAANLVGDDQSDAQVGQIAEMITSAGQQAWKFEHGNRKMRRGARSQPARSFTIDFAPDRAPAISTAVLLGADNAAANALIPGLGTALADALAFVQNAVSSALRAAVELSDGVVRLVLEIGGQVKAWVLDSMAQVQAALSAILCRLAKAVGAVADAVRRLIEFVAALLDWGDIVVVNDVLRYVTLGTLRKLEQEVKGELREFVLGQIDKGVGDLRNRVDQLRGELQKVWNPSFSQLATGAMPMIEGKSALPAGADKTLALMKVQATTVQGLVLKHLDKLPNPANMQVEWTFTDELRTGLEQLRTQLLGRHCDSRTGVDMAQDPRFKALGQLIDELNGLSPADLGARSLDWLFGLMVRVLDCVEIGAKEITNLVLDLVGQVTAWLRRVLLTPLTIPGLSTLFEAACRHQLTLLDALTLTLAAPATVLWKLTHGGQAPFKESPVPLMHQHRLFPAETMGDLHPPAQSAALGAARVNLPQLTVDPVHLAFYAYLPNYHWESPEYHSIEADALVYADYIEAATTVQSIVQVCTAVGDILLIPPINALCDTTEIVLLDAEALTRWLKNMVKLVMLSHVALDLVVDTLAEVVAKYAPQSQGAKFLETRTLPPNLLGLPYAAKLVTLAGATVSVIGLFFVFDFSPPPVSNAVNIFSALFDSFLGLAYSIAVVAQLLEIILMAIAKGDVWGHLLVYLDQFGAGLDAMTSVCEPLAIVAVYSPEPLSRFGSALLVITEDAALPFLSGIFSLIAITAKEGTFLWRRFGDDDQAHT